MTKVVNLSIASPGDVANARRAVEQEVREWNGSRSEQERLTFQCRTCDLDAVPLVRLDCYAQGIINEQVIDKADVTIALMRSRIGTPTGHDISGTVEEIHRSVRSGKLVHVYFSLQPHPNNVDETQLAAVRKFRTEIGRLGLVSTYTSLPDLRKQVHRALNHDAGQLRGTLP